MEAVINRLRDVPVHVRRQLQPLECQHATIMAAALARCAWVALPHKHVQARTCSPSRRSLAASSTKKGCLPSPEPEPREVSTAI